MVNPREIPTNLKVSRCLSVRVGTWHQKVQHDVQDVDDTIEHRLETDSMVRLLVSWFGSPGVGLFKQTLAWKYIAL